MLPFRRAFIWPREAAEGNDLPIPEPGRSERKLEKNLMRQVVVRLLAILCLFATTTGGVRAADHDPWPSIKEAVFGSRDISDTAAPFALYAPAQAADAALVPVSIHLPADTAKSIQTLTLVIDRNPVPVAATFEFGEAFRDGPAVGERVIATRVRVDSFSKVRAIVETTDGKLHMIAKFVAGAGGCSALPSKDADEALASLGKVRVKSNRSGVHDPAWREGVVMVRHPNFTGMQMNPKTGNFTPARFVDKLEIRRGDKLVVTVSGGISLSEDPNLRFIYAATDEAPLTVSGSDNDGTRFSGAEGDPGS
jgi:sulfur-oxidizing protein SoxY